MLWKMYFFFIHVVVLCSRIVLALSPTPDARRRVENTAGGERERERERERDERVTNREVGNK